MQGYRKGTASPPSCSRNQPSSCLCTGCVRKIGASQPSSLCSKVDATGVGSSLRTSGRHGWQFRLHSLERSGGFSVLLKLAAFHPKSGSASRYCQAAVFGHLSSCAGRPRCPAPDSRLDCKSSQAGTANLASGRPADIQRPMRQKAFTCFQHLETMFVG